MLPNNEWMNDTIFCNTYLQHSVYSISTVVHTALGNSHSLAVRVHCNQNGNITTLICIKNSVHCVWQWLALFKQCNFWYVFPSWLAAICTQHLSTQKPEKKSKVWLYFKVWTQLYRGNTTLELPDSSNNQQSCSLIMALPMVKSKLLSHICSDEYS